MRYAITPKAANITAPPTPTTTPMTVFLVFVLIPLELVLPLVLARLPGVVEGLDEMVAEETLVTGSPEMVLTMVVADTDSDVLDVLGAGVVDGAVVFCELDEGLVEDASVVLGVDDVSD